MKLFVTIGSPLGLQEVQDELKKGGKLGLVFEDTRLSWAEVNARSCRFANELRKLGVRRGDRVGLYARNSHQWVEASFAINKIGAVVVTVNNRLSPPEVAYILQDSGATALITARPELPMARLAGKERAQLLLESASRKALHAFLDAWLPRIAELKGAVRWQIEVDPIEI